VEAINFVATSGGQLGQDQRDLRRREREEEEEEGAPVLVAKGEQQEGSWFEGSAESNARNQRLPRRPQSNSNGSHRASPPVQLGAQLTRAANQIRR